MQRFLILIFALFMAGYLPAMNSLRQKVSVDGQQEKQLHKQHIKHKKNNEHVQPKEAAADIQIADLKTDMAAIVKVMEAKQNQVDSNTKEKSHERICPCCGSYSINCPADTARLANGNVLKCGCRECGGAIGLLWVSQRVVDSIGYLFNATLG